MFLNSKKHSIFSLSKISTCSLITKKKIFIILQLYPVSADSFVYTKYLYLGGQMVTEHLIYKTRNPLTKKVRMLNSWQTFLHFCKKESLLSAAFLEAYVFLNFF